MNATRKILILAILLMLSPFCWAQQFEGDWNVRDFTFKSGEKLPELRLHYITLPAVFSSLLIAAAVFVHDPQKQAGGKVLLAALVLFAMNAVVTHATARAAWVFEHGRWPPQKPPPAPPK